MSLLKISKEIRLKSEKNAVNDVEPLLMELKDALSLKDENFYNIMIAVTEAVNNAINHGNKLDPNKEVIFKAEAEDDKVIIEVKDEGEGFDPNAVDDCLDPGNLLKESGRGVFIIRELMDEVNIVSSDKGTTIKMVYIIRPSR